MRLTSFTDYSLRVLIYLASGPAQGPGGPRERATIAEIARAFDISEHHLTKVVHFLGKEGLLANVRGKGGGLELARAPRDVNLGDVVRRTEGRPLPAECFDADHDQCSITRICRLRGVLGEAVAAFQAVLDRYTLEDLVANRPQLARVMFSATLPARGAARGARAGRAG